jgi:hypothetical protein
LFFLCLIGVVELIPLAIGTMFKVYLWIITRYGQPIPSNKFLRKINFGVKYSFLVKPRLIKTLAE